MFDQFLLLRGQALDGGACVVVVGLPARYFCHPLPEPLSDRCAAEPMEIADDPEHEMEAVVGDGDGEGDESEMDEEEMEAEALRILRGDSDSSSE